MNGFEEKVAKLKEKIQTPDGSPFVNKIAETSDKNPSAAAFNIWHANSDVGMGSDKPWGDQA